MTERWQRWSAQLVALVLTQLIRLEAQYQSELRAQACFDSRENREAMWQAWMEVLKNRQRTRVRFK
jgi:hypothetical protein